MNNDNMLGPWNGRTAEEIAKEKVKKEEECWNEFSQYHQVCRMSQNDRDYWLKMQYPPNIYKNENPIHSQSVELRNREALAYAIYLDAKRGLMDGIYELLDGKKRKVWAVYGK